VEIYLYNTSAKRSSNLAPFVKRSKSGDGGGSGDTFLILVECVYILFFYFDERRDLIMALPLRLMKNDKDPKLIVF
jgi:hypothetical protein